VSVLLLLLAAQAVDPLAPLGAPAAAKLKAERVVRRGETVTLRIRQGAMTISTPARALSDAVAGERVRLVVTATRRTIDAVAEAPGVATLNQR
jgi:flagella basal body P-ring formation protein FlgA